MANTLISYLYRDASNYKVHNEAVLEGEITEEQVQDILSHTCDGEFFIPELVGLEGKRFNTYDPQEDTPFFEINECGFEKTDRPPTTWLTIPKLVENFKAASEGGWKK